MRTILNPYYILKPDNGRAFLQVKDEVRAKESERYNIILHPIFAMILSCFDRYPCKSSVHTVGNKKNRKYGRDDGLKYAYPDDPLV